MKDVSFTQNRELSWLKFNDRVLEEAADKSVPLLERLKFLSIFDTNLEEFFMVRIGSLTDLSGLSKQAIDSKSGLSPKEQIDKVLEILPKSYAKKDEVYFDILEDLKREDRKLLIKNNISERNSKSCLWKKIDELGSNNVIKIIVPNSDKCQNHRNIMLKFGFLKMLIHSISSFEHLFKIIKTDSYANNEPDG